MSTNPPHQKAEVRPITRQHLLSAMDRIKSDSALEKSRPLYRYAVPFEGKQYQPILLLSVANELAGGARLILKDFSSKTTGAFRILRELGFEVIPIVDDHRDLLGDLEENYLADLVDSGELNSYEEGKRRLVHHLQAERNPTVVKEAKRVFRQRHNGNLHCEVCSFDFRQTYGDELGEGYIEAHHLRPLANYDEGEQTKISDLILLCANCHRMVHRTQSVEQNLIRLKERFAIN